VSAGAVLVGIDSLNIDGTDGPERPVHSTLLAHDVPVVEHLCGLDAVPDRDGRFFAVPAKVKAFHTFPVRAFVVVS
jgi:kynurenine formamidase